MYYENQYGYVTLTEEKLILVSDTIIKGILVEYYNESEIEELFESYVNDLRMLAFHEEYY